MKVGQIVKFPCPTKPDKDVDWVHLKTLESWRKDIYLSDVGYRGLGLDQRFTVLDKNHSHSLVIDNVTVNDSAYYRCVEDSGLGSRHFYRLTVEGILKIFLQFVVQIKLFYIFSLFIFLCKQFISKAGIIYTCLWVYFINDSSLSFIAVVWLNKIVEDINYNCHKNSTNSQCVEILCCADSPVYSRLDVVVGQSVELLCNTSLTSDIMWSYETWPYSHGYVNYLYSNGLFDNDKPRLSVKPMANGFHSLVIYNAEQNDTGLYNCYDGEGSREVGYLLVIAGTTSINKL